MLSLVSLYSAIKRDHFEEKKKKKGRRNFFGDYLIVSFVKIPRMNAGPCITTV